MTDATVAAWVRDAETIWGARFVAPMAQATGNSRRRVQRWKRHAYGDTQQDPCPAHVVNALAGCARILDNVKPTRALTLNHTD